MAVAFKQASLEAILIARHAASKSPAYRKAVRIVLRGPRLYSYGSSFNPGITHGRKIGPGFYQTQRDYHGGYNA